MDYFLRINYYIGITREKIKAISVLPGLGLDNINALMQENKVNFLFAVDKSGTFAGVIDKSRLFYPYPFTAFKIFDEDQALTPEEICRAFMENPGQNFLIILDRKRRIKKAYKKNDYRQGGFEFAYSDLAQAGYTLAAFAQFLNLKRVALYGINGIARLVYNDFQSNGIEVTKLYTHDNVDYLFDGRKTEQIRDEDYSGFDAVINCANSLDIHIKALGRTRVMNAR